jgi:hypothetical protein
MTLARIKKQKRTFSTLAPYFPGAEATKGRVALELQVADLLHKKHAAEPEQ